MFLIFNSCSTFEKESVECPEIISPKNAAEIVVNSENNLPIWPLNSLLGFGILPIAKFLFWYAEAGVIKTGEKL